MRAFASAALLAAVWAPTAQAQSPASPDWIRSPDAGAMEQFYPKAAAAARVEGRAVLQCTVTGEGSLSQCSVLEESPPGAGFGEAALRMQGLFAMRPKTDAGAPVQGGVVRIPIRFSLPDPRPEAPPMSADLNARLPDGRSLYIQDVDWLERPNGRDMAAAYPEIARRTGVAGAVVVDCAVVAEGRLRDCQVAEDPVSGFGFGLAGVVLANKYRMAATLPDGSATEGRRVRVPIRFRAPR